MKKRIISLLLAVSMLISLFCLPAQAETTTDSGTDSAFQFADDTGKGTWGWASKYIYKAYDRGIFKGDTAGNFNADANLTRAEAVTALLALKGVTVDTSVKVSGFDDADGHWYTPYVAAAKEEGISAGYNENGKTLFKPNAGITRAEFVTMLLSAMGVTVDKTVKESGFADSDGHWYTPYIAAAKEQGLSAGYNENGQTIFKPDKVISRAEAATMVSAVEIEAEGSQGDNTGGSASGTISSIDAQVGNYITFGTYEQDNVTTNGAEPIEWRVLAVDGNKALLISKYALDCQPYNEENDSVTWETCSLRGWLNSDFYNTAFTSAEKSRIQTTAVQNPDSYVGCDADGNYTVNNTGFGLTILWEQVDGGNNTSDKVFLLSLDEAKTYYFDYTEETLTDPDGNIYTGRPDLQCVPTAYAVAQGANQIPWYTLPAPDGEGCCEWWLRSSYYNFAYFVYADGWIFSEAEVDTYDDLAVRPALWVTIS